MGCMLGHIKINHQNHFASVRYRRMTIGWKKCINGLENVGCPFGVVCFRHVLGRGS